MLMLILRLASGTTCTAGSARTRGGARGIASGHQRSNENTNNNDTTTTTTTITTDNTDNDNNETNDNKDNNTNHTNNDIVSGHRREYMYT